MLQEDETQNSTIYRKKRVTQYWRTYYKNKWRGWWCLHDAYRTRAWKRQSYSEVL